MTSWEREAAHWETLWYGGHATREQTRRAFQELCVDDRHILEVLGAEPEEVEEDDAVETGRAA